MVALTRLCGLEEPLDLASTFWMPADSNTARMAPPSGAALYTVIPYLVNPTASTTYNIFGYQNSGGNLNMSALVRAFHIYTA